MTRDCRGVEERFKALTTNFLLTEMLRERRLHGQSLLQTGRLFG
ncbi:MAG: hypothetical protein ACFE0I_14020 [Elainellaceae cyanobacterium]